MKRILITGGTGVLGRELTPRLRAAGYTVRIMSRRPPRPGEDEGLEWAQASLVEGTGLSEALEGAGIVIHAASSPVKRAVDVDGTARLLEAAKAAGIEHFVYISIVGIEQIDYSYYKNKLAAERLIEDSGLPYSIQRATQFHELIDRLLPTFTRLPVAFLPKNWQFQSISAAEVAERLVSVVEAGPSGRLEDIGGPEVLRLGEMAHSWLSAQGKHKPIVHLPVPGGLSAGFRDGLNTIPESRVGETTWSQWLEERYASPAGVEGVAAPENAA
jgi:uncharacterized protein YbjT (DUF2867 family)